MYLKEIQVSMSRAYGPGSYDTSYERHGHDYPLPYVRWTENRNMEEFLRLLSRGQVKVEPLVTHTISPGRCAQAAYETIMEAGYEQSRVCCSSTTQHHAEAAVRSYRAFASAHITRVVAAVAIELTSGARRCRQSRPLGASARLKTHSLRADCTPCIRRLVPAAGRYGERFGAAYCTTDLDQILDDSDIDVVLITSRNQYPCRSGAARACALASTSSSKSRWR